MYWWNEIQSPGDHGETLGGHTGRAIGGPCVQRWLPVHRVVWKVGVHCPCASRVPLVFLAYGGIIPVQLLGFVSSTGSNSGMHR